MIILILNLCQQIQPDLFISRILGELCLGDVLASILQATGTFKVTREYYVNDAGSQINILGNSLYKRYQQIFGIKKEISSEEYPRRVSNRLLLN